MCYLQYFFYKATLSDMHHRKTYMDVHFQQNRVSRSVKTVRSIGLLDFKQLRKEIIYTEDRRTDGWTDVAYHNNMYFFHKEEKNSKNYLAYYTKI